MEEEKNTSLSQLRAIELNPEPCTPYLHSYVYVKTGGFLKLKKGVERKWLALHNSGFTIADSPQEASSAQPMLPSWIMSAVAASIAQLYNTPPSTPPTLTPPQEASSAQPEASSAHPVLPSQIMSAIAVTDGPIHNGKALFGFTVTSASGVNKTSASGTTKTIYLLTQRGRVGLL
eukprot:gene169-1692_t